MKRQSTAIWNGTGSEGKGTLTSASKVLNDTPYNAKVRFNSEDGTEGTNPEELIAAAHAGCFSMALSFQISNAGFTPEEIKTTAFVGIEKKPDGFEIPGIHLEVTAKVPGMDEKAFMEKAEIAKTGCPVSKALSAVNITMTAKLLA